MLRKRKNCPASEERDLLLYRTRPIRGEVKAPLPPSISGHVTLFTQTVCRFGLNSSSPSKQIIFIVLCTRTLKCDSPTQRLGKLCLLKEKRKCFITWKSSVYLQQNQSICFISNLAMELCKETMRKGKHFKDPWLWTTKSAYMSMKWAITRQKLYRSSGACSNREWAVLHLEGDFIFKWKRAEDSLMQNGLKWRRFVISTAIASLSITN